MNNKRISDKIAYAARHWWMSLLLGIFFMTTGIWVLATPLTSYTALSILFSVILLINGIAEIWSAVSMRRETGSWGWILAGGIIDVLIGLLMMSDPMISMTILAFFIGFALLFRSMMAIGTSINLRDNHDPNWGWLLIIGIIGLVLSFILLKNPAIVGFTIAFWTGLAFIAVGAFRLMLSFRLRELNKDLSRFDPPGL